MPKIAKLKPGELLGFWNGVLWSAAERADGVAIDAADLIVRLNRIGTRIAADYAFTGEIHKYPRDAGYLEQYVGGCRVQVVIAKVNGEDEHLTALIQVSPA